MISGWKPRLVLCSTLLLVLPGCSQEKSAPEGPPPASRAPADPVCGALPCELFASPEEAFARVLLDEPAVLAIGETHAQKDLHGVPSTTRRFVEQLLPKLDGKATDVIIELWVANTRCNARQKREIKEVSLGQREITQRQAPGNQSEFLLLYNAARSHKLEAHILVPPCDEYAKILDAGEGDVDAMLTMIARITALKIEERLHAPGHGLVVAYGGAMHNDLAPRPGHERWSFGPGVHTSTKGRYVELDLIVPEMIRDTEAWRAQPWYRHFRPGAQGKKTLLFRSRPGSYALVFPEVAR